MQRSLVFLLCLFLLCNSVVAQLPEASIHVRTVMARGVVPQNAIASQFHRVSIDRRLSDIGNKLRQLPYRHYQLVSTQRAVLPLKKKYIVELAGGHTLQLRVLYLNSERTGVWLRWRDSAGAEVINTRMHIKPSEAVLVGTNRSSNSALVLAVGVAP